MRLTTLILFFACSGSSFVVAGEEEKKEEKKSAEAPSVVLFTDARTAGKGLVVTVQEVELRPEQPAKVTYWITNYLEEEVFVEVREGEKLAYEHRGPNGIDSFAYDGGFPGFPDNIALLKRLHASSYRGGRRTTCGCAIAAVEATAGIPEHALESGKTTVSVMIRGFYRANGKEFCETIDVPVPLRKQSPK